MQTRKFDELISYFNSKVAEMNIDTKYKMELLGMVIALGFAHEKELTAQSKQQWIPVKENGPYPDDWAIVQIMETDSGFLALPKIVILYFKAVAPFLIKSSSMFV